ncbi:putative Antigen C protein [Listeria monocytogenes]|nr:putative Antigen C protein [Listeria monocytogenes]GAT38192.1 putative Antigen C protein [Listeria monocytogenes]
MTSLLYLAENATGSNCGSSRKPFLSKCGFFDNPVIIRNRSRSAKNRFTSWTVFI